MSQLFEVCETNFYSNLRTVQKYLRSPNSNGSDLAEASEALKQAGQELNKMDIEFNIRKQPEIKAKLNLFKDQLRNYRKELAKVQRDLQAQQDQQSGPLFQNYAEDYEKGVNPLIEARRQMYENEQISNEVAVNIKRNNEVLSKNINRMGDINNQLTVAHKLLNSIKTKMQKNKFVMWGTLGFLALVIALVVYSYLGQGGKNTTTTTIQPQSNNNTSSS